MNWFKPAAPREVVIEIEREQIPDAGAESLRSLRNHPGFRYMLLLLKLEAARVDNSIIKGLHADLAHVARLQGARAGLRQAEQIMARLAGEPGPTPREPLLAEREAFNRAKTLIEEIQ